jgi:aquaporin Z
MSLTMPPPRRWQLYALEGLALGIFMIAATVAVILLEYPGLPIREMIPSSFVRRIVIGVSMGLTAICLIYSPIGKISGAHMNPSVTIANWWLKHISTRDALGYILAQCVGGTLGVYLLVWTIPTIVSDPSVAYIVTVPGPQGRHVAFLAEFAVSFFLFLTVLVSNQNTRTAPYTGYFCGFLVALYITVEAPLSGMSMNPARTLASAIPSGNFTAFFDVYVLAPVGGMLTAAVGFSNVRKWYSARFRRSDIESSLSGEHSPHVSG